MDNIKELEKKLVNAFNEEDTNIQKIYQHHLDKIIDAHILLKYAEDKKRNPFYTIDQLHTYILNYFRKIDFYNEEYILNELATKLSHCTKRQDEIPYYISELKKLFEYYVTKETDNKHATRFYNEILNKQQGLYLHTEKKELIEKIKLDFPMTSKKTKNISIGIKLKILFETKNIQYLNIPEVELNEMTKKVHTILKYKHKLNNQYKFADEDYQILDALFLDGNLNDDTIIDQFPLLNKRQIKMIKNVYYKELLLYLDKIQIKKDNIDLCYLSRIVKFNSSHIKFYSNKKELENIKTFVESLTPEEQSQIINDEESINILKQLIPLINIIEDFDTTTLKNIIIYFPQIKEYMIKDNKLAKDININMILNNLSLIIELANVYEAAQNPYIMATLGEDVIKKIISDFITSRKPEDYICTYIEMLENYKSNIPPISGKYGNYIYESGTNKMERLLIGKNVSYSCLGPKGAGEDAYYECLCERTADVLIVKEQDTGKLIGRSILFRRGNFIILAPFFEERGINDELYNKDFLLQISNQIIEKAKENNDNIEYIFIGRHYLLENIFKSYIDYDLNSTIPHCDVEECVHILYSNSQNIKLNIKQQEIVTYWKEREKVQIKTEDYIKDIKRIESLSILSKCETEFINPNSEFYSLDNKTYEIVYIGQDWYIAVQDGEILSQCVCNVSDPRQNLEINETINIIKENNKTKIKI